MTVGRPLALHHFSLFDVASGRFIELAAEVGCGQVCLFVETPDDGVIPLTDFVAALPPDLPWGIEVPRPGYGPQGLSARDHLQRFVDAARQYD